MLCCARLSCPSCWRKMRDCRAHQEMSWRPLDWVQMDTWTKEGIYSNAPYKVPPRRTHFYIATRFTPKEYSSLNFNDFDYFALKQKVKKQDENGKMIGKSVSLPEQRTWPLQNFSWSLLWRIWFWLNLWDSLSSSFEGDSSVCFNPWLCFAPRLTGALTGWFLMKESVIIPQDFPGPWSIISTELDMSALQTTQWAEKDAKMLCVVQGTTPCGCPATQYTSWNVQSRFLHARLRPTVQTTGLV